MTTLWFETDSGDGFREPGFSKERRLDPQITVGLLTDATGMPLMVDAFEGNRAETKTIIPLVQRFVAAHGIAGVTVVADAGMMSEANLAEIEDAGWSFVIGGRLPDVPYVVKQWRQANPDRRAGRRHGLDPADDHGPESRPAAPQRPSTSTRPTGPDAVCTASTQQVAKAEKAVAGQAAIKRNRFVTLTGGTRTVNRELEAEGPNAGRLEAVRDQPRRRRPGLGDRRLPPAVAHRARLPHVQARPASPAGLPPQTRIHRRPPCRRVRCPGHFATASRPGPAGRSRSSSAHYAATAPSRSTPAATPSPPKTPYPTPSAKHSPPVHQRAH